MRRFFRDTGILLVFCGAFYLLTVLVSRLDGESGSDDSDFSPVRKRANVLLFRKDWSAAKNEFKKLADQDPYNGYAWDSYATCIWELRRAAIIKLNALDRSSDQAAEKEETLVKQVAELEEQSRDALLQLKKFSRYRFTSLLRLAALECDRGDYEEAMDYLEEFVGRGYQTRRGLHWIENFGSGGQTNGAKFADVDFRAAMDFTPFYSRSPAELGTDARLHLEPRFWDIVRRERAVPLNF